MTSFSSIYSSLTGLSGFTTALGVVSNNITNLNTPGFKTSDAIFRDIGPLNPDNGGTPRDGLISGDTGEGVDVNGQTRNFSEGQVEATGNATDLALSGNGYFIVSKGGTNYYTRAGQFTFDGQGHLIDGATSAFVQQADSSGNLSDLIVSPYQAYPPTPTTEVSFSGNLSTGSSQASVSNVSVIDASGTSQTLSLQLTNNTATTPGSWNVTVNDAENNPLLTGEIRFSGDGSPEASYNELTLTLPSSGNSTSTVTLNFGDPGSLTGTTSFSSGSQSTVQVASSDGVVAGSLTGITFDQTGTVQLAFSNGKAGTGAQIALANFANQNELVDAGNSYYSVSKSSAQMPTIGRPGEDGFGAITPQSLELANVDLGQEFAKIIILQRGYQGSSQVLNVSSQLLDTLYNALSGH
ncbi:MAG: flagellar hook-basal body complex protein [Nevskiaceae bacterium]|nr:MAG: flagellar hook-basal body complex protein [Nevskiaceae bacterium]TBR75137.1 MAG: flagellar hook-basal body complex protein [Nevskiaceae bacterium]